MEESAVFNKKFLEIRDFLIGEIKRKKFVVDASVVFKWYYKKDEDDLHNAEKLYYFLNSSQYLLFAPGLLIYEMLNIFRLKKEISNKTIGSIISELYDILIILEVDKILLKSAFLHSRLLDISIYDSIYIALSDKINAPLITADKKLYKAGENFQQKVIMLSDFLKE